VGLLLGVVAAYLIAENRGLLLGKAVPDEVEARFVSILSRWASVRAVHDVKTRQITPEVFTLKAEVVFRDEYFAEKIRAAIAEEDGHADPNRLAAVAIHALSVEVDAMEQAVRAAIPEARHIDIEVDHAGPPAAVRTSRA
jgi:solute carrier family 30 (zinc transporter), member 9